MANVYTIDNAFGYKKQDNMNGVPLPAEPCVFDVDQRSNLVHYEATYDTISQQKPPEDQNNGN